LIKAFIGLLLVGCFGLAQAQDIARSALPAEGRAVMDLIAAGGPFPYRRDGIFFRNFEKQLPVRARGYYREYTVPTPGVQQRGARRIVCGGREARKPDACYYTADHYRSFRKITE
jgi:ribonuclease T1